MVDGTAVVRFISIFISAVVEPITGALVYGARVGVCSGVLTVREAYR
jgi:hypothetical protein